MGSRVPRHQGLIPYNLIINNSDSDRLLFENCMRYYSGGLNAHHRPETYAITAGTADMQKKRISRHAEISRHRHQNTRSAAHAAPPLRSRNLIEKVNRNEADGKPKHTGHRSKHWPILGQRRMTNTHSFPERRKYTGFNPQKTQKLRLWVTVTMMLHHVLILPPSQKNIHKYQYQK